MDTSVLTTDRAVFERLGRQGLIIGIVCLIAGAVGGFFSPDQFLPAWLIGYMFCLGLSMGCLAMLMIQHMSGGQWGLIARRIFEAGSRVLPYCLLLFIPLALTLPHLYLWARPEAVAADHVLQLKAPYLNVPFALIRAAIYYIVWLGCMYYLNQWSSGQDRGEVAITAADTRRFRVVSAPGLILYVVLMTFASIDWIMSLEPHWYSTVFGFIMVCGQGLGALALAAAVLAMLAPHEPMKTYLRPTAIHDIGKLTLAFVMLWAYMAFSQFLIIWAGNLPEEIPYYLLRMRSGWQYVSILIIVGHFALPFSLLLSRDLKRHPHLLARVALFILAMRLVDLIWMIAPNFNQSGFPVHWLDVVVPLGLVGIWVYLFSGQLAKWPLVPFNDPYWKENFVHGEHAAH
ncbi:MAG TPA: hypothetical protein VFX12_08725 [Vicinamibacterales bacterium]|nr:hypothetical protein [Vicinamibacterales bacterium]